MAKAHPPQKSWRYANTLTWGEGKRGALSSEGKPDLEVATPADFGGPGGIWTPEDLLVAAVNSCIMTTFLHYRAKADIELVGYSSTAEGELVYGDSGLSFAGVTVKPDVVVATQEDVQKAREALQRAGKTCLISDAVKCPVKVTPSVSRAGTE